jgi:hypothetical protein
MATYISLNCDWCGIAFQRRKSTLDNPTKRLYKHKFCSRTCTTAWQRDGKSITHQCENCGVEFMRNSVRRRDQGKFCTLSCAASCNNRRRPRRRSTPTCDGCGRPKSKSGTRCRQCIRADFNSRTLESLRAGHGTLSFHAKVRGLARSAYQGPMECAACGYSRHVDICHIRGVADWPPGTTPAEVNHPSNLVAPDKRCHWEFDHGYLLYENGAFVACERAEGARFELAQGDP